MSRPLVDPDLAAITAALLAAEAAFVVIGGFSVIANDYVRATEDVDLLMPDDEDNDRSLDVALAAIGAHWSGWPDVPATRPISTSCARSTASCRSIPCRDSTPSRPP
jgi:hypothetical protein